MSGEAQDRLAKVPPEEAELPRQLRQYVRLRWLAIAAIVVIIAFTQGGLGIGYPVGPIIAIVGALVGYNLLFWAWERDLAAEDWVRRGHTFANVQIAADLLTLTILLHLSGGVENPFFLYYFVHIGFGSILLPPRDTLRATGLAIGLFSALVGLEYIGWLPHVHLEGFLEIELAREGKFVLAVLVAFASTLSLVALVATRIVAELRRWREAQTAARELALKRAYEELQALDRMREFFLALASHDLKTPLAVVVNYIQTMLDGYAGEVSPKQQKWLERSLVRLEEMIQLINDFLEASLLDEARIKAEIKPICLTEIAHGALESVEGRARERGVRLVGRIPTDLPDVQGSPKRVKRLLVNLLDNGIKFTPPGGEVQLTLLDDAECVRIEVTDTGTGIPPRYLPHIFEDYFRVQRKEFVPGAGIGLSTARRIVEAHGGHIWVESPCRPDKTGSKFICSLKKAPVDTKTVSAGGAQESSDDHD